MLFNLFGSSPEEQNQDGNGQPGQNLPNFFGDGWPGARSFSANGLPTSSSASEEIYQPERRPDDPSLLDDYPLGRPPLNPEQTKQAYARMFGVDPSTLKADRLEVVHPDAWQPTNGMEGDINDQDGRYSMAAQASPTSGPASPGAQQLAYNAQSATNDGGGGSGNSQSQGDGSKEPSSYSRKLTDLEKYYLRGAGFDDDLLDNITIHSGKPHPVLAFSGQDAVTDNANEIYMRPGVDKPDSTDLDDLEFLAHELHHAVQRRNGMTNLGYVKGGIKHDNNDYEKEAVARAAQAREAIKQLRLQEIRKKYGANPDGAFDN